jgi:hypothetical protein
VNMVQLEPNLQLVLKQLAPSGAVLSAETTVSSTAKQGRQDQPTLWLKVLTDILVIPAGRPRSFLAH